MSGSVSSSRYRSYRLHTWKTGPITPFDMDQLVQTQRVDDFRNGVELSSWRKIVANGGNATTAAHGIRCSQSVKPLRSVLHLKVVGGVQNGTAYQRGVEGYASGINLPLNPTGWTYADAALLSEMEACASRKLFRALRERSTQASGGVILGELGKTLKMLKRPLSSLRGGMKGYLSKAKARRGTMLKQGATSADVKKMTTDTYLEYTFGWTPLLHDIKDILIAAARLAGDIHYTGFKVSCKGEKVLSQGSTTGNSNSIFYKGNFIETQVCIVRYYGKWKEEVAAEAAATPLARAVQLSGFTWSEVLPTAWELLPWSFVVDYFSNIGDVIEAYTACTSQIAWISRTAVQSRERNSFYTTDEQTTKLLAGTSYVGLTADSGNVVVKKRHFQRGPTSIPYPKLTFSVDLGQRQWLNLAALAIGARPKQAQW